MLFRSRFADVAPGDGLMSIHPPAHPLEEDLDLSPPLEEDLDQKAKGLSLMGPQPLMEPSC